MALHSRVNQYWGVNAHLHSLLQNERNGWEFFHGAQLLDMARALDAVLPTAYIALPERSMQIRQFHPDTGEPVLGSQPKEVQPDITIFQPTPMVVGASLAASAFAPTLRLPAVEPTDDSEVYLSAVSIRKVDDTPGFGRPVAWLELLSPTNKPYGDGAIHYLKKRDEMLETNVVLVEMDYLHQSRPILERIPSYAHGTPGAYPYMILLTDPRPQLARAETLVYGFDVDALMPTLNIPLVGSDVVTLDFQQVYTQTYASLRGYSLRVDYEQLPERFDTYSTNDQERIRARMAVVADAHTKGFDLEQGPFPIMN